MAYPLTRLRLLGLPHPSRRRLTQREGRSGVSRLSWNLCCCVSPWGGFTQLRRFPPPSFHCCSTSCRRTTATFPSSSCSPWRCVEIYSPVARPAPSRGSLGLAGVSTRPAHPWWRHQLNTARHSSTNLPCWCGSSCSEVVAFGRVSQCSAVCLGGCRSISHV